jgi:chemotaxis methyl-accepting protein methylase
MQDEPTEHTGEELYSLAILLAEEGLSDRTLKRRVLHKFAQCLCRGGFLCLGSAERLSRASGSSAKSFGELAPEERIYRQLDVRAEEIRDGPP